MRTSKVFSVTLAALGIILLLALPQPQMSAFQVTPAVRVDNDDIGGVVTSTKGAEAGELGWPRVDPNTASAETIYKTLKARFPHTDEALLGQFTVNIIDRRDADDVPTTLIVDSQSYTGIELTACINEVCPDTSSDCGCRGRPRRRPGRRTTRPTRSPAALPASPSPRR